MGDRTKNLMLDMDTGKNKSGRSKQFDIANTQTPDHMIKIQQHYHCNNRLHVVGLHVTIILY